MVVVAAQRTGPPYTGAKELADTVAACLLLDAGCLRDRGDDGPLLLLAAEVLLKHYPHQLRMLVTRVRSYPFDVHLSSPNGIALFRARNTPDDVEFGLHRWNYQTG